MTQSALLCTFEPSFHSCVTIPPDWRVLCLPNESHPELDLFPSLYRISRSIGGSWTELLHTDTVLSQRAAEQANRLNRNKRVCPLCLAETGDSRHVSLHCRYTAPVLDLLRDKMETLLLSLAPNEQHLIGSTESRDLPGKRVPIFNPLDPQAIRWPTLCKWGWLVSTADHENHLRQFQKVSTAPRVTREQAHDLSYRGVIPLELGRTILKDSSDLSRHQNVEDYALPQMPDIMEKEEELSNNRRLYLSPAIRVQHLLILGLRRIRFEYLQRISVWSKLSTPCPTVDSILDYTPHIRATQTSIPLAVRMQVWASSPAGRSEIQNLRATLPTMTTVHARVLHNFNIGRTAKTEIVRLLQKLGVPIRKNSSISYAFNHQSWTLSREKWLNKCSCSPCHR